MHSCCTPNSEAFDSIATTLEDANITSTESGMFRKPENLTPVEDAKTARAVLRLIDALEEYDDVQQVFANPDMSDEILAELEND